tara:strand:- start:498 stop:746 length:249 start_codon:yes stop_codon:yes gene_type:complete
MGGTSAAGFDISGALLADGDFSKVNFKESQLSKVCPTAPRPTPPRAHGSPFFGEHSVGRRVGYPTIQLAHPNTYAAGVGTRR